MSSTSITLTRKFSLFESIFIRIFDQMPLGKLQVELPDGRKYFFGNGEGQRANIRVNNSEFFSKCALYGDVGFAESYMAGDWNTDSIADVVSWFILNIDHCAVLTGKGIRKYVSNLLHGANKLYHLTRRNTVEGSRKNISEHYDLGNDFYSLFLDQTMTYSSGIFRTPETSLEEAQFEKYDRLCRNLSLQSTDHLLEIGSGWGGMAIHAAKNYGCRVTSVTISAEQFRFAKERVAKEGLDHLVEISLQDYRHITGLFDKIVSIEMLEAVGHEYIRGYFSKCNGLLKPNGLMAIQVITSQDKRYREFRKSVDFIQKHIFPGSQTPSMSYIQECVTKATDWNLHDVKDIGVDYARTLRLWYDAFNERLDDVMKLGMDDMFIRKWNYYLQYCEAAFATRHITVKQLVFARPYPITD
ncbi:MAG: cyclopropane-fatty-acyl-phospholipid synthase family protein [Bacteroidota bacterium]